MKTIILFFNLAIGFSALGAGETSYHLKTLNATVALEAVKSYSEGHYLFIQEGALVESQQVDESKPSCVLESGKMDFDPNASYELLSARALDVDAEAGEIELTLETHSENPDAYFMFYCFQSAPGATIQTAQEALSPIFELK